MAIPSPRRLLQRSLRTLSVRAGFLLALLLLIGVPTASAIHKIRSEDIRLADLWPRTLYQVRLDVSFDGDGSDVTVRTFLPVSDAHQEISDEQDSAAGMVFATSTSGANRSATWTVPRSVGEGHIRHSFRAYTRPVVFRLAENLETPRAYPPALAEKLRPEEAIQVDAPEIGRTLRQIEADRGDVKTRLQKIFAFASALKQRPFKGTTDALTALRLGEASCNGKSRLFVALARAAGMPARLVGGLILGSDAKRTSHQWVEVWVGGRWVPFCPTNGHFAELPERYLTLYYGDEALFRHSQDINFDYRFTSSATLVPSPRARDWAPALNVWGLFERLGLSFALLRTVLMLPIGALVVVLFRNVVGIPTFGTFLPALIAAAAGETGALWGVVGVLIIVLVVALVRGVFQRLELLHSPTLAILLAGVTTVLLGTSLLAERLDIEPLTYVVVFPIAVLAITAERFYLALVEHGARPAFQQLAGTLGVMLACYLVMNSRALQVALIGFPEILLVVVAANVYLGRWVGLRISEHLRFRHVLLAERAS